MSPRRMTWDDLEGMATTPEQRAALAQARAGGATVDYGRRDLKPANVLPAPVAQRDRKPEKASALRYTGSAPRRGRGQMSKLELAYAERLDILKAASGPGAVLAWVYEPFRLPLAKRTGYTPDFLVFRNRWSFEAFGPEVVVEFVEVKPRDKKKGKAYWRPGPARTKWKVAARMHGCCGRFIATWPGAPGNGGFDWESEEAPRG